MSPIPKSLAKKWAALNRRFLPDYVATADRLTQWREKVLLSVVLLAVLLGPFALIPSLTLAVAERLWNVAVIDCLAYGAVVFILCVYRRWSLPRRAWTACLMIYALGLGLMFMLGPHGAGYLWLFSASVLAGGLIGLAAGAWSLLLNLAALLLVAAGIALGWLEWPHLSASSLHQWIVMLVNFMFLNTLVTVTTSLMLRGLGEALAGEQRVSASLRESEARFRGLADNAPDVIFTLDTEGRFTYANPAAYAALGLRPGQLLGMALVSLADNESRAALGANLEEILQKGQAQPVLETTLKHVDGRRLEFIFSGAPNHGEGGALQGMVGLLKDVTEQRLLARQLQHSQKMEAVGTLAGGMAHDFNNLLGAMMGYAELALEDMAENGRPEGELKEILRAADQASDLVKRILTFSRKVEPDLKPLDVNQEVNQAARMLGRTIPKMINIVTRLGSGLPKVLADPGQMSQVLMNLGTNARDAMPEGGTLIMETCRVEIDLAFCRQRADCAPGPYLRLSVSDTGHGMDQATMEHIFDPFFTLKEAGKGTGLGLAIVFGIVQSHGGFVDCHSQPGKGTRFDIYLPVMTKHAIDDGEPPPEKARALEAAGTVLVVDDEPALRDVAIRSLARAGYRTMEAENGEAAIEIYEKRGKSIDLVLLDLNMPGMGGAACLKRILELDPKARVLIASGYAAPLAEQSAKEELAAGYVHKPFRQRQLLDGVAKALGA